MNYTVNTTAGVDTVIKGIQTELYDLLEVEWDGELNGYGRVHRSKNENGAVVPEWYAGNNEYEPVYYNDYFAGNFFFIDSEKHNTQDEFVFSASTKLAFMVDLSQIYPLDKERADAKAQQEVVQILRSIADSRYSITGVEKGLENVFSGFDTSGIQFADVHPKHCFAVVLEINYHTYS